MTLLVIANSLGNRPLAQVIPGAAVGSILGLFIALSYAAWHPHEPSSTRGGAPSPPKL
jgi:hypothetical protein